MCSVCALWNGFIDIMAEMQHGMAVEKDQLCRTVARAKINQKRSEARNSIKQALSSYANKHNAYLKHTDTALDCLQHLNHMTLPLEHTTVSPWNDKQFSAQQSSSTKQPQRGLRTCNCWETLFSRSVTSGTAPVPSCQLKTVKLYPDS